MKMFFDWLKLLQIIIALGYAAIAFITWDLWWVHSMKPIGEWPAIFRFATLAVGCLVTVVALLFASDMNRNSK